MNPISKLRSKTAPCSKESMLVDLILAILEDNYDGSYDPAKNPSVKSYVVDYLKSLNGDNQALEYVKQSLPA